MKSLWFVVLCYIFSIVSGFSPFREDHHQYNSRRYDLSSPSSSFDGSIDYSTATDHEDEEFDISFNTLLYLFHKDTKTRSRSSSSSSSDRTNSKGDSHDNTFEVLSVRSPHFSFVNVMERNDKDDDEEEEEFSVHWYEYIDAVATEDVDTDLVVDEQSLSSNKISSEEDSSVTSSMFSLEDRYESDDEDVEIPFVVVTTTTTTAPKAVNENKEATNLDRRMHSLGMISVHFEMEMLKFRETQSRRKICLLFVEQVDPNGTRYDRLISPIRMKYFVF